MEKEIRTDSKKGKIPPGLKKAYDRLIKIRGHPREIALGFALGIFIGFSPTVGFQMAIAIFFAALFKWNKVSSAVGVWISNPLTIPFIYGLTYLVGAKIMGIRNANHLSGHLNELAIQSLLSKAPEIIWALIIGGVIVGLPFAIAGYYFCYSAVQRYQEDIKRKLAQQKEKLARQREILSRQKEKLARQREILAKKREEKKLKKKLKKKKN